MLTTKHIHHKKYEQRLVIFIDILGFKEIISRSEIDEHIFNKVKSIITSFQEECEKVKNDLGDVRITAFSDSIVISYPATVHGVVLPIFGHVPLICKSISLLQNQLLFDGILTRGAVSVGKLYHKENIVFGQALIDAYNLESKTSKYPRVIIDPRILELDLYETEGVDGISWHAMVLPELDRKAIIRHKLILKDEDGLYFVNQFGFFRLARKSKSNIEATEAIKEINTIKEQISNCIAQTANIESVVNKINWLVRYYNTSIEIAHLKKGFKIGSDIQKN